MSATFFASCFLARALLIAFSFVKLPCSPVFLTLASFNNSLAYLDVNPSAAPDNAPATAPESPFFSPPKTAPDTRVPIAFHVLPSLLAFATFFTIVLLSCVWLSVLAID